ncbi:pilus assembly PilX family protein [Colwellia sp. TT2012]|uniref:pilus assembly PilX family protein n=1 Tax=Colwellia sp. TT2012 TaxID=1720342 RepID=UPI00070F1512|nr:hypothetical protein [Colwellia sp. TT2012]
MNAVASNSQKNHKIILKNQQGSTLILALFIIIVLTLLGSTLMRVLSTSSETVAQEVIGTRAYMAANSAMQAELQKLFPLKPIPNPPPTCPISALPALARDYDFTAISGMNHCKAKTSCENYHTGLDGTKYYRLTSTSECGSGDMAADSKVIVKSSRTIQVEARSL